MSTILKNLGTDIYDFPPNIKRMFIDSKQSHITRKLKAHADEVCRNELPQTYINKAFNNYRYGYVYVKGDEIMGFIIWNIITKDTINSLNLDMYPSKYIYIQLLCAKKTGTEFGYKMLSDVESYCHNHSIPCMHLQAANIKLEIYYKKYGFITTQKYPEILLWKPITTLLDKDIVIYRTAKTRKRKTVQISDHDKKIIDFLRKEGPNLESGLNYNLISENNISNL